MGLVISIIIVALGFAAAVAAIIALGNENKRLLDQLEAEQSELQSQQRSANTSQAERNAIQAKLDTLEAQIAAEKQAKEDAKSKSATARYIKERLRGFINSRKPFGCNQLKTAIQQVVTQLASPENATRVCNNGYIESVRQACINASRTKNTSRNEGNRRNAPEDESQTTEQPGTGFEVEATGQRFETVLLAQNLNVPESELCGKFADFLQEMQTQYCTDGKLNRELLVQKLDAMEQALCSADVSQTQIDDSFIGTRIDSAFKSLLS